VWQGRVLPADAEHKVMVGEASTDAMFAAILALDHVPLSSAAAALLAARRHELCDWDFPKLKASPEACEALRGMAEQVLGSGSQ